MAVVEEAEEITVEARDIGITEETDSRTETPEEMTEVIAVHHLPEMTETTESSRRDQ